MKRKNRNEPFVNMKVFNAPLYIDNNDIDDEYDVFSLLNKICIGLNCGNDSYIPWIVKLISDPANETNEHEGSGDGYITRSEENFISQRLLDLGAGENEDVLISYSY